MTEAEARAILTRYDASKYWRYAEMTDFLHAWAALYPGLCRLYSLGQSPEGREVWQVTLTNFATGDDTAKPAYHINAQHHAGEVTAGSVAIYTIHWLLTNYGKDPAATELLDTRAVYVLPRLTVDGTEFYFDNPQMLRSSPLMYPEPEPREGLKPEDVNGDGMILQMRVAHPEGDWRVSDKDPRLMVRRRPEDRGPGPYYRLYTEGRMYQRTPEGVVPAYEGRKIGPDPGSAYARDRGFDFNRNYPTNWKPQHRMAGSGRYPFDRPEIRAMADFWLSHPNIGAAMSYHTYSGMNLRPSALQADDKLNATDLALYKRIGETAKAVTGYPTVSVYEYFTFDYNPERLDVGSWLEWVYDTLGVQGFEMELWNIPFVAGVPYRSFKELRNLPDDKREEEAVMLLQWNDKELDGKGFIPWTPFGHPQFGRVELGGWEPKFVGQNPPEQLLEQECHKNCVFTVEHALSLPLLRIGEVRVKHLGGETYAIAAEVINQGFLPTNVTQVAVQMKQTKPITVELTGAERVVAGKPRQELAHLPGRGGADNPVWGGGTSPVTAAWAEWVIQADPGATVTVSVTHDRAGQVRREVQL